MVAQGTDRLINGGVDSALNTDGALKQGLGSVTLAYRQYECDAN